LSRWHASCSSRSGALSPPARHWRASSCVRQAEGLGEEHLLTYSALALAFSADCRLTIRGGGNRQWTWHRCRQREWARRPGASPPMRMTASWSGSERTYRIQVCGAKMRPNGELPSDQYAARRTSDTGASKKGPLPVHRPSANLIAGDGTKNGLSRSEQKTVSTTQNNRLTGKAPYKSAANLHPLIVSAASRPGPHA